MIDVPVCRNCLKQPTKSHDGVLYLRRILLSQSLGYYNTSFLSMITGSAFTVADEITIYLNNVIKVTYIYKDIKYNNQKIIYLIHRIFVDSIFEKFLYYPTCILN